MHTCIYGHLLTLQSAAQSVQSLLDMYSFLTTSSDYDSFTIQMVHRRRRICSFMGLLLSWNSAPHRQLFKLHLSARQLPRQLCSKWWRCTVPSDLNSTQFNCSTNSSALANTPAGCPNQAWTHNWVESSGYGPLVAYPPASMQVTPDLLADYISNGTALPLKTVAILDQGNTQVIRGEAHNTSGQKVAMSCYNSR